MAKSPYWPFKGKWEALVAINSVWQSGQRLPSEAPIVAERLDKILFGAHGVASQITLEVQGRASRGLRFFWVIYFFVFYSPFGVRRGFKMILSHRAPSSLNMSSYRAIWTHFRPIHGFNRFNSSNCKKLLASEIGSR